MREQIGFILLVSVAVSVTAGALTAQAGGSVVIENFESYGVTDNTYLDPTTVPGSGWTRTDEGVGPDWEVACCSEAGNTLPADWTLDGSSSHLRLRRDNPGGNPEAVQETDFRFTDMSEGSISFEVNPAARGVTSPSFSAMLYDSVSKAPLARVVYHDGIPNFTAIWDVYAFNHGSPAGSWISGFGAFVDTLDRWYTVTITIESNSNFSVTIDDTAPAEPVSQSGQPGEGNLLTVNWTNGTPVSVVDTLRLVAGSGNGASNDSQPTMIDNITQDLLVAAPAVPISGLVTNGAVKVSFPTDAGKEYQPESSDELSLGAWDLVGPIIDGDGTTQCLFDATAGVSDRAFRVLDLDPKPEIPIVEDFEYAVTVSNFVDVTTLSSNWTASLPGTSDPGDDGPDWAVTCCYGDGNGSRDFAFDGSDGQLSLRRDNQASPHHSVLDTDLDLTAFTGGPISNGTVEVQMNPSGVGTSGSAAGEAGAFHVSFYDSVSGSNVIRVLYWELDGGNSGDFEVYDWNDVLLGEGTVPDGNDSFDRWYSISLTIKDTGLLDIICEDIGPVAPGSTESDSARGVVFALTNWELPVGISSMDTFRLRTGSQNGGCNCVQPTRIDNIRAGPFLRRTGVELGGLEDPVQAVEIQYPTDRGSFYQPQYTDDGGTTWFDLGPRVESIAGLTLSAFDLVAPGRDYQVLDLRP